MMWYKFFAFLAVCSAAAGVLRVIAVNDAEWDGVIKSPWPHRVLALVAALLGAVAILVKP